MSNRITNKPTSVEQPTNLFANKDGSVVQLTWDGLKSNLKSYFDGLYSDGANVEISIVGTDHFYEAQLSDMGIKILTDTGNDGFTVITLPPLTDAIDHGGIVRILATKSAANENDYSNMLGIYGTESRKFRIGSHTISNATPLWSLWSSNAGDYIELVPREIPGDGLYWQVINFSGWWADRD